MEVAVVAAGVVWNGFHQVGDQVLPVWQPLIAATDRKANAHRAIELRIFTCPLKWPGSRIRPRGDFLVFWSASESSSVRIGFTSNERMPAFYIELERLFG